jgi:hypothetical protein
VKTDPVMFLLAAAMQLPRSSIEMLAEGLISGLDAMDGDTDMELNGDEADASGDEGDYSVNEREDQSALMFGTGNDQFNPGTPEDAEDDDPAGDPTEIALTPPIALWRRMG